MNLVNVVATGSINRELELNVVHEDIGKCDRVNKAEISDFVVSIKFEQVNGNLLLYSSGKYNIMGCDSADEVEKINLLFLNSLSELGIMTQLDPTKLLISNYVYTTDLNQNINLRELYSELGDNAQYEPEQNSFIIYKPDNIDGMTTISNSGKCVVNTPKGKDVVTKLEQQILNYLD
jgi:TATA-box binding protein (TBP) (component of TFIID and TFIIIB)